MDVTGHHGPKSARSNYATPDQVSDRQRAVMAACDDADREPLSFSLMTGCLLGEDEADVRDRAARVQELQGEDGDRPVAGRRADGVVVGTLDQAAEQLDALAARGVERFMLQNLAHDDLDMVALMGRLA